MPSTQEAMRVPPITLPVDQTKFIWDQEWEQLPQDPRQWTRQHVTAWLNQMAKTYKIQSLKTDRFLMNGKALCLMTIEMYQSRVPLGGKTLFRDFQIRLARALYIEELCKKC